MTLTKYEKETIILFNEGEDTAHIQTYNAGLRKRLAAFSKKHPDLCRLEKSFAQGGVIYVLDKSRLSIRLQAPPSYPGSSVPHRKSLPHGCHLCLPCRQSSLPEEADQEYRRSHPPGRLRYPEGQ